MKYLLLNKRSSVQLETINYIKDYLYDINNMYNVHKWDKENSIIEFSSFPFKNDVFFIKGENLDVFGYLKENILNIDESIIVLITCELPNGLNLKNKQVYQCKLNNYKAELYNDYNFGFDITKSELELYKSKKETLIEKIMDSFVRRV